MTRLAIRADLLDFTGDPGWEAPKGTPPGVRFRADHWLLIENGRIAGAQVATPDDTWAKDDQRGRLLLPGFIDTHVHMPQLEIIASYGTELLDWLRTYTFPAELRYADPAVCAAGAEVFLEALLAHGTTSAAVFPTVHAASADALFAAAEHRGMRLFTGKCVMDRNAPTGLTDTVESAERESLALIERWHGKGRLGYAHTVRFAPTSSDEQLRMVGRLVAAHPGTYLQTHVAENQSELRWVEELFPDARSYLDVYVRNGLLGARAILAHGIWLDEGDRVALSASGSQISHCPSSNLFLGSGLFDWRALEDAGGAVSLGTDVGAGTSLSMLRTMADAYKVQALRGQRLSAFKALYTATRGAAEALTLGTEGSLEVGAFADLAVWDYAVGPVATLRDGAATSLHERIFAFVMLGDERNLVSTYVAGRRLHSRR